MKTGITQDGDCADLRYAVYANARVVNPRKLCYSLCHMGASRYKNSRGGGQIIVDALAFFTS